MLKLIDSHNIKAAIGLQEQSVQKLRDVVSMDNSGIVERMLKVRKCVVVACCLPFLQSKEKGLVDLKTKDVRVARKKMDKEYYEDARMDSFAYAEHCMLCSAIYVTYIASLIMRGYCRIPP